MVRPFSPVYMCVYIIMYVCRQQSSKINENNDTNKMVWPFWGDMGNKWMDGVESTENNNIGWNNYPLVHIP